MSADPMIVGRPARSRARNRGVALVIVLWVIAGLAVVAAAVASSMQNNAKSVRQLRDRLQAETAFLSTSSRVKVMAATGRPLGAYFFSPRGFLFADGRRSTVDNSESVIVQDANGLIPLNRPQVASLQGLLRLCGAPEGQIPSLIDALADYADTDGLKRLNGAEAFEYAGSDLPPPRNQELLSRDELWRVKGWGSIRSTWDRQGCERFVAVHGASGFNRQTAPPEVLQVSGLRQEDVQALIDRRAGGISDQTGSLLEAGSGGNPMLEERGGLLSDVVRVRHERESLEWALEYELELTPSRLGGPWQVHEVRIVGPRPPGVTVVSAFSPIDFQLTEFERVRLNALSVTPFGR